MNITLIHLNHNIIHNLQTINKHEKRKRGGRGDEKEDRAGWQRRTLPHRLQCSTIRARGLNDRVRDGTGWTPTALTTNTTHLSSVFTNCCCLTTTFSANKHLLAARAPTPPYHRGKPSTISIAPLHTLLRFHARPIKLVVCQRSYSLLGMGSLILRWASHLDAFSGYPLRSSLPGLATGVTTGTRALRPPRSSRTRGSSSQTPNAHSG